MVKLIIMFMIGGQMVATAEHPFEFDNVDTCYEFGAQFQVQATPGTDVQGYCEIKEEV